MIKRGQKSKPKIRASNKKLRKKEPVFHSRKCSFHSTFDLSATQSIPTTNEQMMKINLHYVLLQIKKQQILHKLNIIRLTCEKLTEI